MGNCCHCSHGSDDGESTVVHVVTFVLTPCLGAPLALKIARISELWMSVALPIMDNALDISGASETAP